MQVENLSTTLKLVNFLVDGFEDEPQIAGPLILAFLNIFKVNLQEKEIIVNLGSFIVVFHVL